jgi:uncharacterized surface protein with fasciclin (FAS1) repeats
VSFPELRHLESSTSGSDGPLCDPSVLDTAKENSDLTTVLELLEIADLTEVFSCSGPFTFLAPSNAAFEALDPATIRELLLPDNKEKLQDLLLYHILPGLHLNDDFEDGKYDTLLVGQTVDVSINPVLFNGRAQIEDDDNLGCNGVVHVIGDVLVPGTYRQTTMYSCRREIKKLTKPSPHL